MPKFELTEFEKQILAQAERAERAEQDTRARAARDSKRVGPLRGVSGKYSNTDTGARFSITGSDGKPIGPLRASQGHTMNESWVAQTAQWMRANNLRSAKVKPYYEQAAFSDRINARMTR